MVRRRVGCSVRAEEAVVQVCRYGAARGEVVLDIDHLPGRMHEAHAGIGELPRHVGFAGTHGTRAAGGTRLQLIGQNEHVPIVIAALPILSVTFPRGRRPSLPVLKQSLKID